jgi:hypothetical protein
VVHAGGVTEPKKDVPPTVADIVARAGIKLIPGVGPAIEVIYEGVKQRWNHRAGDVVDEITKHVESDHLCRRLEESEQLDAAFATALATATQSAMAAKRRLLGAVIARAVLDDSSLVDDATLISAPRDQAPA